MSTTHKQALVQELIDSLRKELDAMERAQRATVAGATSEHAKPEHAKDTRALEQTYLARGQARRVEELREAIARVTAMPTLELAADAPIALGALVTIDEADDEGESRGGGATDAGETRLLIAPAGGGSRLAGGEQVVTPSSPLGRALMGKRAGEVAEVVLAGRTREISIRHVG